MKINRINDKFCKNMFKKYGDILSKYYIFSEIESTDEGKYLQCELNILTSYLENLIFDVEDERFKKYYEIVKELEKLNLEIKKLFD